MIAYAKLEPANAENAIKLARRAADYLLSITPGEGETIDSLMNTADAIMQDLSMANGGGLDNILENATNNPEYAAFSYKQADGSSHITLPLCTEA